MTLWQTVIYFVYKLSLNCRSRLAIAGCPPDSSSSRQRTSTHSAQRRKLTAGQLSRFHHKRPMASKFADCKLGGLSRVVCNVGAYRKLKTKPKTIAESKNCFRLSGATYHKNRSTRLWKTSQIKRLKACVGAWRCRWTLRTFTVTMEFWHLIIS